MKLIKYVVLICEWALVSGFVHPGFFKNYMKNENLDSLTFFDCHPKDAFYAYKSLIRNHKISVVNAKRIHDSNFKISPMLITPYKNGFVLHTQCLETSIVLSQVSQLKRFTAQNYFFIFDESNSTALIDQMKTLNISINAEIRIIKRATPDLWFIYDVYNPGFERGGQLNTTHIGYWNGDKNLSFVPRKFKYFERQNFNQLSLRAAMVITEKITKTFIDYLEDHKTNIHLDTMHNLDLKRVESWGYSRNGAFDGMVGLMERQEIDIAGSPLFFWKERLRALDYTIETWVSRPSFIFRHPLSRNSGSVRIVFLQPLDNDVWICLAVSLAGSVVLLRICSAVGDYLREINEKDDFSNIFVSVIGIICQQGVSFVPRFSPSRIIFLSLLFNMLMVYQFYSASIVSSLLMERPKYIKNLRNLIDSGLDIGIEDILYTRGFFNLTKDPVALELYQTRVLKKDSDLSEGVAKEGVFLTPLEGLKKIQRGGYAFHVDSATAYPLIRKTFPEYAICDLWEVQLIPVQHMIGSVAKASPYREMITYGLRRQVETGIVKNLINRFVPKRPECIYSHGDQTYTVQMEEFWPAFILLCFGFAIGWWILVIEIIYFKYNKYLKKILGKLI